MEKSNKKEVKTDDYRDVKKMQDAIVENSTEFERLGLSKLKGSNRTLKSERERLTREINKSGIAQCDACNQTISSLSIIIDDEETKTSKEAQRIKDFAKNGTTCRCCGNKAILNTLELNLQMCISLIEIVKFYRHNPDADESKYYTKEDFFAGNIEEYGELFENFELLHHWDLLSRMPTRPDKVVYKDGWYGITENGIKFVQREIGVPKTCYAYNGETDSFESDFVTIEEILSDAGLKYEDLIKVEENE
jgi:ribosomal protein L34E